VGGGGVVKMTFKLVVYSYSLHEKQVG